MINLKKIDGRWLLASEELSPEREYSVVDSLASADLDNVINTYKHAGFQIEGINFAFTALSTVYALIVSKKVGAWTHPIDRRSFPDFYPVCKDCDAMPVKGWFCEKHRCENCGRFTEDGVCDGCCPF